MSRRTIAVLGVVAGMAFLGLRADAQVQYGDLLDYPGKPNKGQSMYAFLKVDPSPRAVGMGSAFICEGGTVDAIFYNAGGLGFMSGGQYVLSYTRWLANADLYTGAFAYRIGANVYGVSVVSARAESFEETTIYRPLGTGRTVQPSDLALGIAFARQMTDKVAWGIHARWIQEDLFLATSSSWDVNLGISAYTGFRSIRIAAAMRNLGKDVTVETRPYSAPVYFNFGLSGELLGDEGDPSRLTVSAETLFATDYGQRWHFGGEYWVQNTLALRGGYRHNYDVEEYSVGFGLSRPIGAGTMRVDVSYSAGGDDFDAPLRAAIGGSF